jgi:hypothetical protein
MGLVSAAASAFRRCSFSQSVAVPSRIETNVISLATGASLTTAKVSLGMQMQKEANAVNIVQP